jgi:hypothetical protein
MIKKKVATISQRIAAQAVAKSPVPAKKIAAQTLAKLPAIARATNENTY